MSRLFSPEEVQALIKRAAQLQQMQTLPQQGLTEEELEKLADEAGISKEAMRAAMDERNRPAISAGASQSDTHIFETRDVKPAAGEHAWQELIDELRHTFGTSMAKVKVDHEAKEWIHLGASGIETRISMVSRGEGTRLRLSQRVGAAGSLAEAIGYGAGLAGLVQWFAHGSAWYSFNDGVFFFAPVFVIMASVVYMGDRIWRRRKQRQLSGLGDRLAQLLAIQEKSAEKTGTQVKEQVPIKRISLDDVLLNDTQEDRPLVNRLRNG
jgi:hypothetical protein